MSFLLYWMWTIHQVSFNAFWGKSFQVIWLCWKTAVLHTQNSGTFDYDHNEYEYEEDCEGWKKPTFVFLQCSICSSGLPNAQECEVCVDVCCGISLRRKLDFSAMKIGFLCKENWISLQRKKNFPFAGSGFHRVILQAGNLANWFQIRNRMGLLLKSDREFCFI